MKTPLQTLLDERALEFDEKFPNGGLEHKGRLVQTECKARDRDSFLQGVRLGLAMGRECVPDEKFEGFDSAYEAGSNTCRDITIAALEGKEKELGV